MAPNPVAGITRRGMFIPRHRNEVWAMRRQEETGKLRCKPRKDASKLVAPAEAGQIPHTSRRDQYCRHSTSDFINL